MTQRPDPRSRAAEAIRTPSLLKGSLVKMARTCGSKGCRCTRGQKHVSWYLSVKHRGRRKMVYLPPQLLADIRNGINAYQQLGVAVDEITYETVERLLKMKRG